MARFDGEREMLTKLPPAAPTGPAASKAESATVAPTRVTRLVRLGCEHAIGVDVLADSTDRPPERVAEARRCHATMRGDAERRWILRPGREDFLHPGGPL